jgi:hypothetical protein
MFIIMNKKYIIVYNNEHYEFKNISFIAQTAEDFGTNG